MINPFCIQLCFKMILQVTGQIYNRANVKFQMYLIQPPYQWIKKEKISLVDWAWYLPNISPDKLIPWWNIIDALWWVAWVQAWLGYSIDGLTAWGTVRRKTWCSDWWLSLSKQKCKIGGRVKIVTRWVGLDKKVGVSWQEWGHPAELSISSWCIASYVRGRRQLHVCVISQYASVTLCGMVGWGSRAAAYPG